MKIEYHKNPLDTTIELDDREQEIFKMKIREKELLEIIEEAHFTLTHHEWRNTHIAKDAPRTLEQTMAEAADELDLEYVYSEGKHEGKGLNERVDTMFDYYMADLKGSHAGDCICLACSCVKCQAEQLLGVDTIKGLGKHSAYKINSAFGKDNEKTIDEALEHLRTYDPQPPTDPKSIEQWERSGGWAKHLPRWKDESMKAYEWLLNYRNTLYMGT